MSEFTEENGWMPGCEYVPVEGRFATERGQMYPQALVFHVMVGYMGYARTMMEDRIVGDDADDYASWHFSVGRDGHKMQHASIWDGLWHAGLGSLDPDAGEPVSTLRARFGRNPNLWIVGIENEGFSVPTFAQNGKRIDDYPYSAARPWPEPMIASNIEIARWVIKRCGWLQQLPRGDWANPDTFESRFIGHNQIDPRNRKDDPGDLWQHTVWHRIVNGAWAPAPPPRELEGPIVVPPAAKSAKLTALETLDAARKLIEVGWP